MYEKNFLIHLKDPSMDEDKLKIRWKKNLMLHKVIVLKHSEGMN